MTRGKETPSVGVARELGIGTVAVCSEVDRHALHAELADITVTIGPAEPGESYLRMDRILEVAAETDADAIHPGYGFLAENAAFARACAEAGVIFIGPSAEVIEQMGEKTAARAIMEKAGVPVVPSWKRQGFRWCRAPFCPSPIQTAGILPMKSSPCAKRWVTR